MTKRIEGTVGSPRSEKILLQLSISRAEREFLGSLARKHGMTISDVARRLMSGQNRTEALADSNPGLRIREGLEGLPLSILKVFP